MSDFKKVVTSVGIAIVVISLVVILNPLVIISSGNVGIIKRLGIYQENILGEGVNFRFPFLDKVEVVDCKIQRDEQYLNGATRDLQDVKLSLVYNYKLDDKMVVELYKKVGKNYINTIVAPVVNNVVKTATSEYTAEELITMRSDYTEKILSRLNEKLNDQGIRITEFTASDISFSVAYNQAIENKQVAQQEALKSQQELEKIKIEAEQKVVQAKAEAEALRVQNQEVTDKVLELRRIEAQIKAIEKWNGQLPSTQLGDSVPFINIR